MFCSLRKWNKTEQNLAGPGTVSRTGQGRKGQCETVQGQQGRGNYFEVGGGERLPGPKITPTQN